MKRRLPSGPSGAPECPTQAIFHELDVPPKWAEFVVLNGRLACDGGWPNLHQMKDCIGHPANGTSKRELLVEA